MNKTRPILRHHRANHLVTNQKGVTMILVLITGLMLAFIGLSLAERVNIQYSTTSTDVFAANAVLLAEAGVEQTIDQLNLSSSFSGYSTPQEFFNNQKQGYGTFTTSVTNGNSNNEKIITSTGTVYRSATSSTPVKTREIKVTTVGTSSTSYSVYTGPGGLILSGSASIVNSAVYVNGYIKMSGSSNIGSYNQPLTVDVANDWCPQGANPGSTYPEVCSDGTQPITMGSSTHIYGSVCATGQTNSTNISGGSSGSGLEAGCTAPQVSTPTYDRSAQIAAVTETKSSTDSSIDCKNKSVTWPANLEITGDVDLKGSCNLTITGNVYITGNFTMGGSAKINIANSLGTTRPVIMTDGTINIGGSGSIAENSNGTSVEFISFKSAASCSPGCSSVTGTDLYNSQSEQNIVVGGAGTFPGALFDAYWSEVVISGSGTMGSAIGQTVNLSGSGTVTFGTTLSSGQQTWTIRSYEEIY